ncbi:FxLYD domain-containing protein, partial [Aeromonas veronii]|uniref:FxLYD domain-containing protein n=1 Tax=Aeromonas veronii TaxID=654 RepID=UPI0038B56650
ISTDVFVEALVENTGDGPSGDANVEVDWYNEGGNFLDNDSSRLASLPAGETWEARVNFLGSGGEEVDDFEIDGEFDTEPRAVNPE